MRILVISDVHANLTALEAVLSAAGEHEAVWCLGDLVGYGPDPNDCVQWVRQFPNLLCLIGNHDAAALDLIEISSFNEDAQRAIRWTQKQLSPSSADFLLGLPDLLTTEDVTLAHGSPRYPIWEYLLDNRTATQNFANFATPFCFVGHSHLPLLFQLNSGHRFAEMIFPEPDLPLAMTPRAIYNPGSVGQPRDRDPRASYAIFDSEALTWEVHRVSYDIASVQIRMREASLPEKHIRRLITGW